MNERGSKYMKVQFKKGLMEMIARTNTNKMHGAPSF